MDSPVGNVKLHIFYEVFYLNGNGCFNNTCYILHNLLSTMGITTLFLT